MNEIYLLVHYKSNMMCLRYHTERARSIAYSSGFFAGSYDCAHFAKQIEEEQRLARKYRARILLYQRAMMIMSAPERELLLKRFLNRHSAEALAKSFSYSLRTFYRRQKTAVQAFEQAVSHLVKVRQKTAANSDQARIRTAQRATLVLV